MDAGTRVVVFSRTLDAFAFEDAARASGLVGRLIPLPTGISATCGLAWRLPPDSPTPDRSLPREGVYLFDGHTFVRVDA